uniref:Uncharacterized protein n=1 Tax=Marseillevirus LCMAC201 TaxID=2506605 RepID=A0A481YVN6_9VIRU|nr:MAG: hypothetical protein LCMAC201_01600 [Marseillevirus LCMAC201]
MNEINVRTNVANWEKFHVDSEGCSQLDGTTLYRLYIPELPTFGFFTTREKAITAGKQVPEIMHWEIDEYKIGKLDNGITKIMMERLNN